MRTFIKSCFSVAVACLLTVSLQASAAESAMSKNKNEPLEKCKTDCLSIKDATAYEGCMVQCNKTYQSTTPALPTNKK
ncbi:MAG: hypothetical protein A3D32_01870 [Candidatus Muproteobacteria bacterium RIFCSPHIGHO2_02_FULL_60_13]|nr:MAG: hypothetical protein A3D32_01870 [Candidatus Muproteobacteria bacterium RIFCSPHIGHO2_02_FULL_60_13]